jgi:perosamine synthetase
MKIFLARPDITNLERRAVLGVLKTPNLSLGPKVKEFEEKIAKYIGVKYAIAVNSGTSALHLIIRSLGIKKEDEVVTTPFSFIASANCILFEGAKPVFVDIDEKTLNIDPKKIEDRITKKTKAILAVDIFGNPANWDSLERIAKKHKLYLIEDSAEAFGSKYRGKKCGSFGIAGVFSFYPNKQITMGEGGAVVTNNEKISNLCLSMRNQGRSTQKVIYKKKHEYRSWLEHERLGYNYRVGDMNCALGIAQLKRIKEILRKRERVVKLYNKKLKDFSEIELPHPTRNSKVNWFVYVIRLKKGYSQRRRDRILAELRKRNIQCSDYFPCIHLQLLYKKRFGFKSRSLPVAESVSQRTIALPFYSNLKEKEINYVVKNLKEIISRVR